jgi:hypothetical protein
MPVVPSNALPPGQALNPVAEKPTKDNLLMALATMHSLGKLDTAAPGPQPAKPPRGMRKVLK